jgi:hypothetical protein
MLCVFGCGRCRHLLRHKGSEGASVSNDDYERGRTDARLTLGDERHQDNIKRFSAIEAEQKATNEKLDGLIEMMTLVKGGFRMLLAVGSFGAAVGAVVTGIFHYFAGHWK